MMRALALLALLAGCSAPKSPEFPDCPAAPRSPVGLRPHETVGDLEIRVELSREDLARRLVECAAAVRERDEWIERMTR